MRQKIVNCYAEVFLLPPQVPVLSKENGQNSEEEEGLWLRSPGHIQTLSLWNPEKPQKVSQGRFRSPTSDLLQKAPNSYRETSGF